jgi:hypothetical protein
MDVVNRAWKHTCAGVPVHVCRASIAVLHVNVGVVVQGIKQYHLLWHIRRRSLTMPHRPTESHCSTGIMQLTQGSLLHKVFPLSADEL